jgi:Nickel/cobalt transporter regulator
MKSILLATLAATAFLIPTVSHAADRFPEPGSEQTSREYGDNDRTEYRGGDRDRRSGEGRIEGRSDNGPGNGPDNRRGGNRAQGSNVYVPAAQPDGRYYDRNRDGNLDRRWDRNRDDHLDRNWDRNRDGRLDRRYDRNDDERIDRRYDRNRDGNLDRHSGYHDGRRDDRWGNDRHDNRWNTGWRNDRRYDWRSNRDRYGSNYRQGRYSAPQYGRGYGRISIGVTIGSPYYGSRYWVKNPDYYRLPPAYGPYRWVRYYDDVLLVDIRSGYVVDMINNFFW